MAGEYEAEARIDRRFPVVGHNVIEIEVKDGQGKSVTVAKIRVNYYMAPMNYMTDAKLKGVKYKAKMNLETKISTAKFNVNP